MKEYTYRNDKGDARLTVHTVFPGIDLTYNSVHTDCCCLGTEAKGEFIEIHHCREGRMEQRQGKEFFYLMPGDLSLSRRGQRSVRYSFPLRHYHGISIIINTDEVPECFSCFLEDVNVRPKEVAGRLCSPSMRRSVISTGRPEITWKAICRRGFIVVWCNLWEFRAMGFDRIP